MTDKAHEIGKRLLQCRTAQGWTMKETAQRLGVSQSRYGNWEQGLRVPKYEQAEALADLFSTTAPWIVGWTDHGGKTSDTQYITADRRSVNVDGEGITLDQVINTCAFNPDYVAARGLDANNLLQVKIDNGDEILIDRGCTQVDSADRFALLVNGRVWVRLIRPEISGGFTIVDESNEAYPDQTVDSLDALTLLGRICRTARDH